MHEDFDGDIMFMLSRKKCNMFMHEDNYNVHYEDIQSTNKRDKKCGQNILRGSPFEENLLRD